MWAAFQTAGTWCIRSQLHVPLNFLEVRLPPWKQCCSKLASLSKAQREAYKLQAVISFLFVLYTLKKVLGCFVW